MTEKRFTYDSKTDSILKDGEFWLDGSVYTACNHSEICDELNALNDENEQLKTENKELQGKASSWKITVSEEIMEKEGLMKQIEKLNSENKMLKFTIARNESYIEKLTHKGEWGN